MIGIPAVDLIGFDPSNFYSSQEWDFLAKQDEDKHLYEKRAIRTRCPRCLDP